MIGAHMGHPFEALLIQYMLKWPDLYLSNSAYLARYMDPALVSFMDSSRGMGRVLFASDHPFLPMERAAAAARDLPLSDAAAQAFLGGPRPPDCCGWADPALWDLFFELGRPWVSVRTGGATERLPPATRR